MFDQEKKYIEYGNLTINFKGILIIDEKGLPEFKPSPTLGHYLWNEEDKNFTIVIGKEDEAKTEIKVSSRKC